MERIVDGVVQTDALGDLERLLIKFYDARPPPFRLRIVINDARFNVRSSAGAIISNCRRIQIGRWHELVVPFFRYPDFVCRYG